MLVANATGCSSIYGGNLPTTPYCTNEDGRGPAWSNSLFEDNAEFGLGFRVSIDKQREIASKGGRAAHAKGTAHEWSAEEARRAGRKGGQASRGGRGKLPSVA